MPADQITDEELRRYIDRCTEMSNGGEYSWWTRLAEILAALTTEPAAPPRIDAILNASKGASRGAPPNRELEETI